MMALRVFNQISSLKLPKSVSTRSAHSRLNINNGVNRSSMPYLLEQPQQIISNSQSLSYATKNQAQLETRKENLSPYRSINKKITKDIKKFMQDIIKSTALKGRRFITSGLRSPERSDNEQFQLQITKMKYSPEVEKKTDNKKKICIDNCASSKSYFQPGNLLWFGRKEFKKSNLKSCSSTLQCPDVGPEKVAKQPEKVAGPPRVSCGLNQVDTFSIFQTRKYSTIPDGVFKMCMTSLNTLQTRSFNTSTTMFKSKKSKSKKKCEKKSKSKFKSCCPPRAREYCSIDMNLPPCVKQRSPYKSFSELECHDVMDVITECEPPRYLQPRFPIFKDLKLLEPPPPKSSRIDPDVEEECLLQKSGSPKILAMSNCDVHKLRGPMKQGETRKPCGSNVTHEKKEESDDKKGESIVPQCSLPPPCPTTCSPPPIEIESKSLWTKVVGYFKARPNCPAPGDWKKKFLREKAEAAARDAGLCLCEPNRSPATANIAKHYSTFASRRPTFGIRTGKSYYSRKKSGRSCDKPPKGPCDQNKPREKKKKKPSYSSSEVLVGRSVPSCDKSLTEDPCSIQAKYKSCKPRSRDTCDKSMYHRDCCYIQAPYPSFTECHPPFQRLPMNECSEQLKILARQQKKGSMRVEAKKHRGKCGPKHKT